MTGGPRAPHGQPRGWYVDPYVQGLLRWWDGGRWAEETRPIPREERMPVPSSVPQPWGRQPADERGDWGTHPTAHGPAMQWESPRDGYHDGRVAPGGQTQVQREPPRSAQAGPVPSRHADEPGARIDESFTYTNHIYTDNDRGERSDVVTEVVGPSKATRGAVANKPSQETKSAAEEIRRSALNRLVLSALFGLSLVLYAAGFTLGNDVLRLVALTGALFFGVGTAPLQLSERASLELRLCVAGLTGLSVPTVIASVMVLRPMWHPSIAAALVGIITICVHVMACRRVLLGPLRTGILRSVRLSVRDFLDPSLACCLLGTLLWLAGMATTGHVVPGVLGFLPKAPVYWYLGLVLLVAGIMLARGRGEARAAFGVVSLLAALTVTPAVVYGMPRSASAAKHIDLVQNILQFHYLNSDIGIYKPYSGFFSAVAWLCDVSAMHNVTGIATYFPFFIDLIAVAGLRFFLGRLTASRYRIWVALTLVILVNSIGADYFSPQAVGFALAVGVFGLALDREVIPGLSESGRLGILLLAGCSMAVTHELSPYMVGGVLIILVVFRIIRPWYVPAIILVPAGIWAFLHRGDLGQFLSLSDLGNLSNFKPPQQSALPSTPGLSRLPIVGEASDALLLGLLILIVIAGVGLLRNIRSRAAWAFLICPSVGLVVIAANPYGNEGIFRAALFGIPWLAAVGTQALPRMRSRWSSGIYGVIAACLAGAYLVSMFGLDNANVMRPSDYQALLTYQATAAQNSYLLDLSDGDDVLPGALSFPLGAGHALTWDMLITQAQAATTKPTSEDADAIAQRYYKYAKNNDGKTSELYAIWSASSVEYSVDYGLETLAQAQAWRTALIASPDWKAVYSSDGTYLFRVMPNVIGPTKGKESKK
jgi:hypothetical protein